MSGTVDTNNDGYSIHGVNAISKKEILFAAVENGKLDEFQSFKGEFNLLGDRDGNGETYLHRVIYKCTNEQLYMTRKDMITYLLAEVPQLTETKNMDEETPLCLACKLDIHYQAIVQLLEVNPKMVMVANIEQKTPLHHFLEPKAVLPNKLDSLNIDVSRLFDGNTSARQLQIVKLLISHGADMHAEDKNGNNPLHFTLSPITSELKIIEEDILRFLLQKGATFSSFSDLVLSLIAVKTLDTAKLIIKNHASEINKSDEKGWTVLHHVIENYSSDQDDILGYLIDMGAVVEGDTNLMSVLGKRYHDFRLIEKVLDKYPEYINARINHDGTTLLMRYCGDADIVENLLLRGADVSLVNYLGDHALLHAVKSRNRKFIDSIKLLLDAGSDPTLLNKDKKDILYLIFCNMKKFAGSSSDSEETENLENTYLQEFEVWYELFKHVLNLPPYRNLIMNPDLSFIFFRLIDMLADAHTRSLKLIKPFEMLHMILQTNIHISEIVALRSIRPFRNQLMSIQFCDSFVEPITSILLSKSYCYLYSTLVEFIHAMLDAGLPVSTTPVNCVTPLTAVLIRKYQTVNPRDIESREHVLKLTEELIVRNVNVGSMALKIKDNFEAIQNLKVKFMLPDALFLAFLNNEIELVEMLLPHWWAPPIALMIFKIPIIDENIDLFVSWFTFLLKYARIPHGSDLYACLKRHMENWFEELVFAYPADHEEHYKWRPIWQQFNQLKGTPLTLRELSKFAVRHSLAARASHPGTSLPALLQETIAPTLHFLVMM